MAPLKSSGRTCLHISIVMITLATTAIVLRAIARARTKQSYATEDWLIVAALLIFGAYDGVLLQSVINGGGSLDETELTIPQISDLIKAIYVCELLFNCTITTVKISVLCFYRTIFSIRPFLQATLILGLVCLVWFVITEFILIFQCHPVSALWELDESKCMPFGAILFGYELTNLALDICILCLSIHRIAKLQLPKQQKIMIGAIFLLGGFVCVACILRMIYLYHPHNDQTVSLPPGMDWSTIELGVAIVAACLPTLRALLPGGSLVPASVRSWYASLINTTRGSQDSNSKGLSEGTYGTHSSSHYMQFDHDGSDTAHLTNATGGSRADDRYGLERPIPMNAISVKDTVEVV